VCLDSGAHNYDQIWVTTSLRGLVAANLTVRVLKEAVHSGQASGVVPSSFRIIRNLLDRIEDSETGRIKIPELYAVVPQQRVEQMQMCAGVLGDSIKKDLPLVAGARTMSPDNFQLLVNRLWTPTLSITGVDGIPNIKNAGNVLRTHTTLTLSVRCPPTVNADTAGKVLKAVLEANPPYGAEVKCDLFKTGSGWESPAVAHWVQEALDRSSNEFFKKPAMFNGEGGSIPFMGMLGEKFPEAQFVITGVLGPGTNAHGPNEFLPIDFGVKVTACVSSILADHHKHFAHKKK